MTSPALDLFSWVPPKIYGDRDGSSFDRKRDLERLNRQARAVYNVMADGEWHTLREISERSGAREASASARLRDLRKPTLGGFTIERKNAGGGLWLYRMVVGP